MKKYLVSGFGLFLAVVLCISAPVEAKKKKVVLNKTKVTLELAKKATLKVKNAKGKVKWHSSNKEVASVSKGKVTAKKLGKATITAKVGKKKYACKVTVTILKKDQVNDSEMVYANDIFTKAMLQNIVRIEGRFQGAVKDKKVIQAAFNNFSSTTLIPVPKPTPAPKPEEALYGYGIFKFFMKDGSMIYIYTYGDELSLSDNQGQRYKADRDFYLQVTKFLEKYAV